MAAKVSSRPRTVDIMSAMNVKSYQGSFGPSGPGMNARNLDTMGWLPGDRVFSTRVGVGSVELAALNVPNARGYLAAKLTDPANRTTTTPSSSATRMAGTSNSRRLTVAKLRLKSGESCCALIDQLAEPSACRPGSPECAARGRGPGDNATANESIGNLLP